MTTAILHKFTIMHQHQHAAEPCITSCSAGVINSSRSLPKERPVPRRHLLNQQALNVVL